MKILDRYLLRRLVLSFVLALFALSAFYAVIDLLTHRLDDIIESSMPWTLVLRYYLARLPDSILHYLFTGFAMLMAVLLVMGSSARANEMTAMLSVGIPLSRQAFPALALAALVSLATLAMSQWIGPGADRFSRAIEAEYFGEVGSGPWAAPAPVSWSNLTDGWTCHVTEFNRAALSGEEVLLLARTETKDTQIRARRIYWDEREGAWIIEDGVWTEFSAMEGDSGIPGRKAQRVTQSRAPIRETPADLFAPFDSPDGIATTDISGIIETAKSRRVPVQSLQVELQGRFARAALPLIVVLFGLPLAARVPRGRRSGAVALAFILMLAYFLLIATGENLGRMGRVDPALGSWAANIAFLICALLLIRRTPS